MLNIKLTERAKKDLRSIVLYTREAFGSRQATRYVEELQAKIELLAKSPKPGTLRPELRADIRSSPFKSHTIFYYTDKDNLMVVTALHNAMEPSRHIKQS